MKERLLASAILSVAAISAHGQEDLIDATEPIIADQPAPFQTSSDSLPWYERDRIFGRHQDMLDSGISPFLFFDSITAANVGGWS